MGKLKHLKIIEEYISNLTDKDFTSFCDRLLYSLFPEAIQSSSILDNGYNIINNNIFIVVPNEFEDSVSVDSLLPDDLQEIAPSSITFLSKDSFSLTPDQKKQIRETAGKIRIDTWGLETLKLKLSSFDESEQYSIIDDDSTFTKFLTSEPDILGEMDIIHNIFNYIKANAKPITSIPDRKSNKYNGIVKKIKLNFTTYQSRVFDMYQLTYYHKSIVEKYFRDSTIHDKTEVMVLKEFFRSKYCEVSSYPKSTYPVNEYKFMEMLANACLEAKLKSNKQFSLWAKAVVMYFFEYCDFGARNKKETFVPKNPTLFDNINADLT
ncbi:MAG: hypothetical protein PHY57_08225 [Ignavibacterium sp.]|nr:hypothetical protein [Ignavibacterium sp.]